MAGETGQQPRRIECIPEVAALERVSAERERRYTDNLAALSAITVARFEAGEKAVSAAFAAQAQLTQTIFRASEQAITKAETAQVSYNLAHNDLTRKMERQYETMVPREMLASVIKGLEEKRDALIAGISDRHELVRAEVAGLRESRAELAGKASQLSVVAVTVMGIINLLMGAVAIWIATHTP